MESRGLRKLFKCVSFAWGLGGRGGVSALVGERGEGVGRQTCLQIALSGSEIFGRKHQQGLGSFVSF